jgi:hypothetical protein
MTSAAGTCSVKYDQAGNGSYNAAPGVTESVTATKAGQTITVTTPAPSSAVFGSQFTVGASGGGSGNPVTLSSGGGCSNSGATFTMTSGTTACQVEYDEAGNGDYNPAPQVTQSVGARKAAQSISVTTHAPARARKGSQFTVAASAPGGPVAYSSAGSCSNSGATFTITSAGGTCTVKYDQAGSSDYEAAPEVTETVSAFALPHCVVPKLKGLTLTAAKRALKAHACSLGRVGHSFSPVQKGRVISETPKPGKRLQYGAKVSLIVSKGRSH